MSNIHLQIVSGSNGVKFTAPNKFTFRMPTQYAATSNDQVSLKSLRMYYSWFNITAAKNNNSFSYIWNGVTYPVVLPDGIYSYQDFQGFFNEVMYANNHYLMNNGLPVYYISFQSNPVYYRISLTLTPIPSVLPEGYTAPPGFVGNDDAPQIVIPATAIRDYLGFNAGTYPAVAGPLYQTNSTNVPQVTEISSLMLQSNLCNNEYGPDPSTLATFGVEPGTSAGSLISEVPFYQDWIDVQPRKRFDEVTLTIVDQNSRPVTLQDTSGFICTLTIRKDDGNK